MTRYPPQTELTAYDIPSIEEQIAYEDALEAKEATNLEVSNVYATEMLTFLCIFSLLLKIIIFEDPQLQWLSKDIKFILDEFVQQEEIAEWRCIGRH